MSIPGLTESVSSDRFVSMRPDHAPPSTPNTTSNTQDAPITALAQGWTIEKIDRGLRGNGLTRSSVARDLGVSYNAILGAILFAKSRPACYFIAGVLGVPPANIWPQFLTPKQDPVRGKRGMKG